MNPERAPQLYESTDDQASKYFDYDKWEVGPGSEAKQCQREWAVRLLAAFATQAPRIYARFAWSWEASDHANPAAPGEDGGGRLFQFLAKSSSPVETPWGFNAAIFARLFGWSSGVRRRGDSQLDLFFCFGGTSDPIAVRSKANEQLPARSWRPAHAPGWLALKTPTY